MLISWGFDGFDRNYVWFNVWKNPWIQPHMETLFPTSECRISPEVSKKVEPKAGKIVIQAQSIPNDFPSLLKVIPNFQLFLI